MSKDTIRLALGLPVTRRRPQTFTLTREQVAAAFAAQRRVYDERGYHTFDYWREQTEGMAALGEGLAGLLEEAEPELFAELRGAVSEAA